MRRSITLLFLVMIPALLLSAGPSRAQQDTTGLPSTVAGYSLAVFIGDGIHPSTGHILTGQIGVKTITKNILTGIEVSGFKTRSEGSEINAVRSFIVRDIELGAGFLFGIGVGGWDFIDTEGNDIESAAATARFSYWGYGLRIAIGGDAISMSEDDLPNRFIAFAGLTLGL